MAFILAKKLNMSQVFTESGEKIPVTVLLAGPCKVVQVKTHGRDGYDAVQVGFGRKKKLSRALLGHMKGESFLHLREFLVSDPAAFKSGQELKVSDFAAGQGVDVTGTMKGRGFAGAVKRHGFHGAPATHGHDHPRAVGSIGSRYPQHTLKGTRMAGRMGGHLATVKSLSVLDIDPEKNYLIVSGSVPGASGSLVMVTANGKILKKPVKLYEPSLSRLAEKAEADAKSTGESTAETAEAPVSAAEQPAIPEASDNKSAQQ